MRKAVLAFVVGGLGITLCSNQKENVSFDSPKKTKAPSLLVDLLYLSPDISHVRVWRPWEFMQAEIAEKGSQEVAVHPQVLAMHDISFQAIVCNSCNSKDATCPRVFLQPLVIEKLVTMSPPKC